MRAPRGGDDDGRDGLWLLEQVRRRLPDTRRVLMSGGQPAIDAHLESGLVGFFLSKPVGAKDVFAVLRTKLCVKCGAEITDPQLRGDERCGRCGDGP